MTEIGEDKGRAFEARIQAVLQALAHKHVATVFLSQHPAVVLQNEEIVHPDFHLIVELPYERSHYFIECQDRNKFSKYILHKIQHVRAKQALKTFIFVYPTDIPAEVSRAMQVEGVMLFPVKDFEEFIAGIDASLAAMGSVPRWRDMPDRSVLNTAKPEPPKLSNLSPLLNIWNIRPFAKEDIAQPPVGDVPTPPSSDE